MVYNGETLAPGVAVRRAFLIFGLLIIVFDVVGSLLVRSLGTDYEVLFPATLVIYVIAGYVATLRDPWYSGVIVGASVSAIDNTVGTAITQAMGIEMPPIPSGTLDIIAASILVIVLGGICGAIGAAFHLVGRLNKP